MQQHYWVVPLLHDARGAGSGYVHVLQHHGLRLRRLSRDALGTQRVSSTRRAVPRQHRQLAPAPAAPELIWSDSRKRDR